MTQRPSPSAIVVTAVSCLLVLAPIALAAPAGTDAAAASQTQPAEAPIDAPLAEGQVRAVFPVEGMHCGNCSASIKTTLKKLDGIVAAAVDHTKGTAIVVYQEAKLSPEKIVEEIGKVGYQAALPKEKPEHGAQ